MKKIRQYRDIVIYFGITAIGIIVYWFSVDKISVWGFWGALDSSFAVAMGILAIFVYRELAREEDVIEIKFQIDNKIVDTGLSLLRRNFQRSEVMGILGMITKEQGRFKLEFLQNKDVLKKFQDIQKGKEKIFIIKMTKEEAKQFHI